MNFIAVPLLLVAGESMTKPQGSARRPFSGQLRPVAKTAARASSSAGSPPELGGGQARSDGACHRKWRNRKRQSAAAGAGVEFWIGGLAAWFGLLLGIFMKGEV